MADAPGRIGNAVRTFGIMLWPLQLSTLSDLLPYRAPVPVRLLSIFATLLLLSACAEDIEEAEEPVAAKQPEASSAPPSPAVTPESVKTAGDGKFWLAVETARKRGAGDPDAMARVLRARFAQADDEKLRAFQQKLVDASSRLYTWQHWNAAEMICGFVSDDVFTDWRSWVITLGREKFTRVAEDPDNLADIADLSGGCEAGGEIFGAAVSDVYFERHGYADEDFPVVEPFESPDGEQVTDPEAIRRALPRLAARIREDGLGRPPRTFN
jgi:hypothetical protein